MTATGSTDAAQAEPQPAAPPSAGRAETSARPEPENTVHAIGIGITLLAALVLGFVFYLYYLSGVQEARTQTRLYATLSCQLAELPQCKVAPLGAAPPGSPVAVLNIPVIGIHNEVVVEGTSPENLELGPGHLRNTSLPGQAGIAVLYGRRATFGGPFGRIPQLRPGDLIKVTTGQGTAVYRVKLTGDSSHRILINPDPDQLLLLTADSALVPRHYLEVSADLVSKPQPFPGGLPSITPAETALSNDPNALILTMAWGLALVAVSAAGTVAASRWARWPAYLITAPVALAIVWCLYENIAALLPNLY